MFHGKYFITQTQHSSMNRFEFMSQTKISCALILRFEYLYHERNFFAMWNLKLPQTYKLTKNLFVARDVVEMLKDVSLFTRVEGAIDRERRIGPKIQKLCLQSARNLHSSLTSSYRASLGSTRPPIWSRFCDFGWKNLRFRSKNQTVHSESVQFIYFIFIYLFFKWVCVKIDTWCLRLRNTSLLLKSICYNWNANIL